MTNPGIPGAAVPLLVGREREQTLLRDHLAAARAGHGSLVLISGEAGIGKTALAETLCREATERNALVLIGRCYDLTETPPYGPWVELFGQYRQTDGSPLLPAAFAQRGTVGEVTSQTALFQHISDFFLTLGATQPLLLLLDDLHWADPASLDLLRFLARTLADAPILVVMTYRTDELTRRHHLYQLLPLLVREAGAERLDLRHLNDDAVRALVDARYGLADADTRRLVAYLQARAEGNALFVGELLRSLAETGILQQAENGGHLGDLAQAALPMLLRQVIDRRVSRLDVQAQDLLAIAAVIGHEVSLDVWASVANTDETVLLDAIEQATTARLVVATADGLTLQFTHALIREALYEGILPMRRRLLHRRAGEVLAALSRPDPDAVAFHFERAHDPRSAMWLVAAGERAENAYAYLIAADRFERALIVMGDAGAEAKRGWLLVRLGILYSGIDMRRALASLEAARPYVTAAADPVLSAYALTCRGRVQCTANNTRDGLPELEAGVHSVQALPADLHAQAAIPTCIRIALEGNGETTLVVWLEGSGRLAEARALGERLVATHGDARPLGSAFLGLGLAYAFLGLAEQARESFEHAREEFRRLENHGQAYRASAWLLHAVLLSYYADDVPARHRLRAEAERDWERMTSAFAAEVVAPLSRLRWGESDLLEGEWEGIEEAGRAVFERSGATGGLRYSVHVCLGSIARYRGNGDVAWEVVRRELPQGPDAKPGDGTVRWALFAQKLATELSLDTGDLVAAKEWLEAYDRWLAWSSAVCGQSEGQALWARYFRQAGDADHAYECARQALELATEPRQPLALLAAHRLLGELDTDAGRFDDAVTHFDAALALADSCAAPFERALSLLSRAKLHEKAGRHREAGTLLEEVRAICTPLGARPTLDRADALAATLSSARHSAPTYPAGLSTREVEVLRLLATGRTNREIADTLFLSAATVNGHVTHILTKTNTTNRTEAAAFALRHGLAGNAAPPKPTN